MFLKAMAVVIFSVSVFGCANFNRVTQQECSQADWNAVGYDNSTSGYKRSAFEDFAEGCAAYGIQPNREAYFAGYEDGLKKYCTTPSGYAAGKVNDKYRNICPPELEDAFKKGYYAGKAEYRQNEALKKQKFNRRIGEF